MEYPTTINDSEQLPESARNFREAFVRHYFKTGFRKRESIILAGYIGDSPEDKARELLDETFVQRLIYQKREEIAEDELLTRKHVIIGLMEEGGRMVGAKASDRVAAYRELSKILAMPVNTVRAAITEVDSLDELSDSELLKIINGGE